MELQTFWPLAIGMLAAGFVQSAAGFGYALVAIPVLALFLEL
ncbi:MAG TPA: sulfite exporter TauE/SafE family protein, partial [Bryobacterales bacterium]|nr:sulfite exporter TauE/SafE family protein [Bryobacterales bacterium]